MGSFPRPALPKTKKTCSFGFIDPKGQPSWATFPETADAADIVEAIAKEAGGIHWPLRIEGKTIDQFDFKYARDGMHNITWGNRNDVDDRGRRIEEPEIESRYSRPGEHQNIRDNVSNRDYKVFDTGNSVEQSGPAVAAAASTPEDSLVVQFTEARAAAVEAEFGQLIISCLDSLEGTIDTLLMKKVELLKEKARIEATIRALEKRLDMFKQKADSIIEVVDPYEKDVNKLQSNAN